MRSPKYGTDEDFTELRRQYLIVRYVFTLLFEILFCLRCIYCKFLIHEKSPREDEKKLPIFGSYFPEDVTILLAIDYCINSGQLRVEGEGFIFDLSTVTGYRVRYQSGYRVRRTENKGHIISIIRSR